MKIREVADLVGISVRTLHHYDEIGLLSPKKTTDSRYRIYTDDDLAMLQQILFFKELGFPLKKIKEIIHRPSFDREEALRLHRKALLEKRRRLDQMIKTVDKTIQHYKGGMEMTYKEKFAGFDFSHNPYEEEARQKWGNEMVDKSKEKINQLSNEEREQYENQFHQIYRRLAKVRHEAPESAIAQNSIKEWYDFLNKIGTYSLEAFQGLGQLYVDDERFKKNIDQFGEGLAVFMRDAMAVFAKHHN